ncbi:IclR family transcriptional regulator [Pseudomonas aeruginosa]|nr:IclR family transcriptional regulator [Pseudomonas aeruginosa]
MIITSTNSNTKGPGKDVGAVVNAVHLLRHLANVEAPEGVTSIARATGISPSSAYNILRTLSNEHLVAFNAKDKTYQLGLGLSELAVGFIGRSYADLIQPELERLSLNHSILITLWQVTADAHIRVIARSIPPIAHINVVLGARIPELAGAAGRCIAALRDLPGAELRRRFTRIRWENPPSLEQYQSEMAEAAERGWGVDRNLLYRGVSTVSSAIVDREGEPRFVISAIGISAQHEQDELARIGASLRETTRFISRALFS